MFTRARTMLALGITVTAAAAAFLWTLPIWDRLSERGHDTELDGAMTLSVIAVLLAANAVRVKHDKQARTENLAAILPLLADRLTPHDGDGQDLPQPQWYHYLKRPA